MDQKRLTAKVVWIEDLHSGTFVHRDDAPNGLVLPDGREVARANLIGTVVNIDEGIVIDDGTGSVLIRSFDGEFSMSIGTFVRVIGRVREFMGEKYILGETVKTADPKWFELKRKTVPHTKTVTESPVVDTNNSALDIVRSLDSGEGAAYEQVIEKLGEKGDDMVVKLLAMGELFETRPGWLKVLE